MRRQYDFSLNADAQSLSPSALNNYMDCSLRFYLHHIEKIKPPKELSDELDNSVLGRVFHKAVELIYREIGRVEQEQGKAFPAFVVSSEMIEGFLKISARIERAIERAFDEEFFGNRAVPRSRYNGEQLVYFGVVKQFVRRLLEIDKTYAPFTIEALEQPVEQDIAINGMQLRVGGIVDRIDSKAGVLRVVDYKTGGYPKEVSEMDKLFESGKDRANYIFQAFLYSSILVKKQTQAVQPALVYIQKATDTADYSPAITWAKEPIQDFRELAEEFETALHKKLAEVFNPSIAFTQTENTKVCEYCDFREMCGR
ncbi:MAG: PD-(D/E)XK nuclease family protein [Prevotellaceae bacterium]|nr:PD-(D/E)XK nuclease family protein [Prevotellaceae bacterium]